MAQQQPSRDAQAGSEEWQTSLFKCFPCGPLWKAICCPCVVYGQTAQRLRDPTVEAEPRNPDCIEFAIDNLLFSSCYLHIMNHRAEIRSRYHIRGSPTSDCLVAGFCCACAVQQHDEELKARLAAAAENERVSRAGYTAEKPMSTAGMAADGVMAVMSRGEAGRG